MRGPSHSLRILALWFSRGIATAASTVRFFRHCWFAETSRAGFDVSAARRLSNRVGVPPWSGSEPLEGCNDRSTAQALTNPLLSPHVFNEETFTKDGLRWITETRSLHDIIAHQMKSKGRLGDEKVTMTRPDWKRANRL